MRSDRTRHDRCMMASDPRSRLRSPKSKSKDMLWTAVKFQPRLTCCYVAFSDRNIQSTTLFVCTWLFTCFCPCWNGLINKDRGAKTSWVRFPDSIMFTKARHLYSLVNDHSGVHIHTSTQDNSYSRHLELHIHDEKPLRHEYITKMEKTKSTMTPLDMNLRIQITWRGNNYVHGLDWFWVRRLFRALMCRWRGDTVVPCMFKKEISKTSNQ